MFLEMRTYVLKPGMTNNFVERFAEGLTARLQFSKLLGLLLSEVGGLNRVVHVWPYDSFEDRERIGGEAQKNRQVAAEDARVYCHPGKQDHPAGAVFTAAARTKLGELYEFRTYTYQPGAMPTVLERWSKVIGARTKVSPLVFAGQTLIGPLNQYIHVWAYKDAGERERLRAEASKTDAGWPPPTSRGTSCHAGKCC